MTDIKVRMTPCSYVLLSVLGRLQAVSVPGIKPSEIGILPEGNAPASMGERYILVSAYSDTTVRNDSDYRGTVINFRVNLIQRMRSTPNDRFGIIYTNNNEMHDTHETIKEAIQSLEMFMALDNLIDLTEESNPLQKEFSIARTFVHLGTTLNPVHLYPGFFLTKPSEATDKIAGYMTYQTFQSPTFYPTINPLLCEN